MTIILLSRNGCTHLSPILRCCILTLCPLSCWITSVNVYTYTCACVCVCLCLSFSVSVAMVMDISSTVVTTNLYMMLTAYRLPFIDFETLRRSDGTVQIGRHSLNPLQNHYDRYGTQQTFFEFYIYNGTAIAWTKSCLRHRGILIMVTTPKALLR